MAAIGGQVFNAATDDFINGATIVLTEAGAASKPQKFVTETRGLFLFENLPPGRYVLFAECPGFARAAFGSRGNPLEGVTLSLVEGQQLNSLAFGLTPGSSIAGKVTNAGGLPVEGANVLALRPIYQRGKREWAPLGSAVSDGAGDYKIENLSAGNYLLAVNNAGPDAARAFYPASSTLTAAERVTIAAAAAAGGKDIRVPRTQGHRVSGSLATPGKAAIAWLTPKGGATGLILRLPAKIQSDGAFAFPDVEAGSYVLSATEADGITPAAATAPVTVGQKDVEAVTLRAQGASEVTGEIALGTNENALPPGMQVILEPADAPLPRPPRANVDEHGKFAFHSLPAGHYYLHVQAPETLYVRSARYRGADVTEEGLDAGGAPSPLLITLSAAGALLGGVVRGPDGNPMPGATVALVPTLRRFSRYKEVTTDQFGEFHFSGITPGEYRVYGFNRIDQGQYEDAAWLRQYESKGQPFTAKPGGHETIPVKAVE
jgi:hypothetical protein